MSDICHVAIGICTFRRPAGLTGLLQAIGAQKLDHIGPLCVTLVIVDNDDETSAQDIAERFRDAPWPIVYCHQPKRGLVHARNTLLDAVPQDCRWLAMIDDDEVPVANWLAGLLLTARNSAAPIVAGPVEPIFREPPPQWAIDGEFFRRTPERDGAPTNWVSTQNALIDMRLVRAENWRFHMEFNRSGGEDEHFFQSAISAGHRAVVSQAALVQDDIPPHRVQLSWMWKRNFRMGTTLSKIDLLRGPKWQVWPIRAAKSTLRLVIGLARLIVSPLSGKVAMVRGYLDIARALGALAGLFGVRLKLYG